MDGHFEPSKRPYKVAIDEGQPNEVRVSAWYERDGTCQELWLAHPESELAVMLRNPTITINNGYRKDLISLKSSSHRDGLEPSFSSETGAEELKSDPDARLYIEFFVLMTAKSLSQASPT
ncbi:hypothetical protein H0X09_02280 [Candidatus Saccharibacteria bacterium]|nr:hypothetical protein [Candidatus Saccharibacteria bacterium]